MIINDSYFSNFILKGSVQSERSSGMLELHVVIVQCVGSLEDVDRVSLHSLQRRTDRHDL